MVVFAYFGRRSQVGKTPRWQTPRAVGAMLLTALAAVIVTALATGAPVSATPHSQWSWPVASPYSIMRTFIAPPTPYSPGHRGIDISTGLGSPVFAPADGVVSFAGVVVDRPVLSLRHSDGVVSSYEPVLTELLAGATVSRGETIGVLLDGHCKSPCLHFGTRRYGEYLSPLGFLGRVGYSVLLPTRTIKLTE